ncbi:MAG TPA: dihydrofolate reductase family protein [Solirubrobacteraceae bacterium]|jgi:dihydrofolate reductase
MGKLVVTEFITLDGVFEDPGGAESFDLGGWAFKFDRGNEGDKFKLDELMSADAQLLGRTTYEGFAAAWPRMSGNPFAEKMNGMPKFVFSGTLQEASWNNSTILRGDLATEVQSLKDRLQGDVLVAGSGQLVRGLLDAGLVDELRLMVFPTILGRGKQLFDGARPTALRPVEVGRAGATTTIVLAVDE